MGDLARQDEYGEPDPWTAERDRLLAPPVNPLTGEGLPGLSGAQADAALRRGASNLGIAYLPSPKDTFAKAIYGARVPGEYWKHGTVPKGPSEADQFRADALNRAGVDWGVRTGAAFAGDPLPGLYALSRGLPLRSTTAFGAGAGQAKMGELAEQPKTRTAYKR
jgi:hypothetical protein